MRQWRREQHLDPLIHPNFRWMGWNLLGRLRFWITLDFAFCSEPCCLSKLSPYSSRKKDNVITIWHSIYILYLILLIKFTIAYRTNRRWHYHPCIRRNSHSHLFRSVLHHSHATQFWCLCVYGKEELFWFCSFSGRILHEYGNIKIILSMHIINDESIKFVS